MLGKASVLLFLTYLTCGEGQSPALKGWLLGWATDPNIPLLKHGNKSYYMGVNYKATFLQAMQFCDIVYMKLLTIESKEENQLIQKYILNANKGNDYWTAGSRALDEKNWVWLGSGKAIEYTNWGGAEPNNKGEKCLQVTANNNGLFWNDLSCNIRSNFICQRDNSEMVDNSENLPSVSPNINLFNANGKNYYFSRDFKGNFLQAAFFCRMLHMNLATVNSQEENLALQKYIRDTHRDIRWWTAGTRFLDTVWTWFTNGQHVEYTNWAPGQPDSREAQRCLTVFMTGEQRLLWDDVNCNDQYNFICESPVFPIEPRMRNKREIEKDLKSATRSLVSKLSTKCSTQPVVNVYINNNMVQEGVKTVTGLNEHTAGEYSVDVANNLAACEKKC